MINKIAEQPVRIAIIGGGVGAMMTLFELTSEPDWESRYEITVYQMGWRLGGKGASGRNVHKGMRIEEHGLHMWWGFYDHAFDIMKRCYAELEGELFSLESCFVPQNSIAFIDSVGTRTYLREVHFPPNDYTLGLSSHSETSTLYASLAARWLDYLCETLDRRALAATLGAPGASLAIELLARLLGVTIDGGELLLSALASPQFRQRLDALLPGVARWLTQRGPAQVGVASALARSLCSALGLLRANLRRPAIIRDDADHKQSWYFWWLDFLLTAAIGLLSDGVVLGERTLADLDDEVFSAWLSRHGLSQETLSSVLLRGLHDAAFCFKDGNPELPNIGTGVILHTFIKMFLTYKGSYIWRLAGGMGDMIFAPLYLALKRRAEKAAQKRGRPGCLTFRFFHRVDRLGLSPDRSEIATITLGEQTRPKAGEYQPFLKLPDMGPPVWPAEPLYDQLVDGEKLQFGRRGEAPYNLESMFCSFPDVATHTLEKGRDYDLVVLGIPPSSIARCCPELIAASPAWSDMVSNVRTIRTQAAQLWLREPIATLGFTGSDLPIVAGFRDPLNSWADMSHTLRFERHPPGAAAPGAVLYFCGPMLDDPAEPTGTDDDYPATQTARVYEQVEAMLSSHGSELLPNAFAANPASFLWGCLYDASERAGSQRLLAQYFRANIDPAERYVLSLAGSTKYRLRPGQSGFGNLVLTGDWTRNGIDFGCVESAACSGFQAAQAVRERAERLLTGRRSVAGGSAGYRPPFIEVPALQVFRPPYVIGDMTMQFYVIAADRERLQATCDRYLNAVTKDWQFEPIGPIALVIFGYTGINRSVSGPESLYGAGTEQSLTVAIPVVRRVSGRVDIGMFPLLAIVDNSLSLSSGREIHGFAKSIGWFSGDMTTPGAPIAVETMVFERFARESQLHRRPLVAVRKRDAASAGPGQGMAAVLSSLLRGGSSLPGLDRVAHLTERSVLGAVREYLEKNDLAIYNLLQLRDPQHPSHCRLQVVTRSRFRVTDFRALGFLPTENQLEIHAYDSHPILAELTSLPAVSPSVTPLAGLWLKMDTIQSAVDVESGYGGGSDSTSHA